MEAPRYELAELHFHLGQSIEPHILWSIAHEQGIKLPTKDYHRFVDIITLNKPHVTWSDYHNLYRWTELIQSSPSAMERSLYENITGAYRTNNITLLEPGFNPMYRNRGGEQDLDQIILASLRGMERALAEFPKVRAGIIFMLDRRLPFKKNKVIVQKAIKYRNRGVIGIDIAGPHHAGFDYKDYIGLYTEAQEASLKTTTHIGEDGTPEEMDEVLNQLPLDRINHGIKAVESKSLMRKVVEKNLTLCLCPSSNLKVGFIKGVPQLKKTIQTLYNNGVKICFNTDSPSMLRTNLVNEISIIRDNAILTESQIQRTIKWAFEASFINLKNKHDNLYL